MKDVPAITFLDGSRVKEDGIWRSVPDGVSTVSKSPLNGLSPSKARDAYDTVWEGERP